MFNPYENINPDIQASMFPDRMQQMNRDQFIAFTSSNSYQNTISEMNNQEISIDKIQASIANAYNCMQLSEEAIILLGDTDAGKSTFANYLAGIPLQAFKSLAHGLAIDILNKGENCSPIGHLTVSQTINPKMLKCKDSQGKSLTIWDAPGFGDTRGPNVDIPNCYMIKTLFKKTKRCKIVFVVSESSINDHNKSQDFMRRVNQIMQIFADISKIYQCVFLAVTRVSNFASDEDICTFIKKELIDIHTEFTESEKKILELFTEKQRILLFCRPTKVGPIEGVGDILYQKFHTFPYEEIGEVKLALSENSLEVIKAMCWHFVEEIERFGRISLEEFSIYFEDIIKKNDLNGDRINMLTHVRKILEDLERMIEDRSVGQLNSLIIALPTLKNNANVGELRNALANQTQQLEAFIFFTNMLDIEINDNDFFKVKNDFQNLQKKLKETIKSQEELLSNLLKVEKSIKSSIYDYLEIINSMIMEYDQDLKDSEEKFSGDFFIKIHTFEEFYDKFKFVLTIPLFNDLKDDFSQINQIIDQSRKDKIYEFLNESPDWRNFWKKTLKTNLHNLGFELIKNYQMIGLLNDENLSKEKMEKRFQNMMAQKYEEITKENVDLEEKIQNLQNEKEQFGNNYVKEMNFEQQIENLNLDLRTRVDNNENLKEKIMNLKNEHSGIKEKYQAKATKKKNELFMKQSLRNELQQKTQKAQNECNEIIKNEFELEEELRQLEQTAAFLKKEVNENEDENKDLRKETQEKEGLIKEKIELEKMIKVLNEKMKAQFSTYNNISLDHLKLMNTLLEKEYEAVSTNERLENENNQIVIKIEEIQKKMGETEEKLKEFDSKNNQIMERKKKGKIELESQLKQLESLISNKNIESEEKLLKNLEEQRLTLEIELGQIKKKAEPTAKNIKTLLEKKTEYDKLVEQLSKEKNTLKPFEEKFGADLGQILKGTKLSFLQKEVLDLQNYIEMLKKNIEIYKQRN